MDIQFNEKNGVKTDVVKQLICQTLDIVGYTGFVFSGTSTRAKEQMAMVCLALANVKSSFQEATAGKYLTSKEIIKYWNEFLGDTMSTGSYDSVRDNAVKKLVDFRIVLSRAEQESLTKNSSTAGYTLAESFISLMKLYDTDERESALNLFIEEKKSVVETSTDNNPEIESDKIQFAHQQIFYGAPGTGKSHTINEKIEGESVIRTTFHPDSDYSTFVGTYKPTMGLLPICDELGQPMKIGSTVLHKEQIIYEFVDQAFLQAYVNAWKFYAENGDSTKKQYLVIEEINRGNCAQIFGDLFQLLDRNDYGFSVYPINADKDMKKHIEKAFKGISICNADNINQHYKGRNVVKEVLDGDILLLPSNLYIWATMNTSDQSLFPIDSAFKRRWEWQYMPIGKGFDENGHEIKWAIEGVTQKFDWWSFLEKINAQVGEATQSEDKKLGFFFCKATDGVISAEKFVGKVIFYLWNDVFKNNGFEGSIFKDVDGTELSFGKFYKSDMKGNAIVQKDKVELFLNNLGVEATESIQNVDREEEASAPVGTKEKVLLFWQGFNNARSNNQEYCALYNERKPSAQTFMDLSFGSSDYWPTMNAVITKSIIRCGIWIGVSSNKDSIYSKLKSNETAINELVGLTMTFTENAKTCSIMAEKHIDLTNESNWTEAYTWLMDIAVKIKKVKDQFGI